VSRSDEENERQRVWQTLSEAGLVEIRLDEFAERLREVKRLVSTRLHEFLGFDRRSQECESAAHSLGTLKGLELKLHARATQPPKPSQD
jgi:hypothetical protein